jgi:malonate transporter and related proteins
MIDVVNLALPFFGLIFLGYLCGRLKQIPASGLAWLNFFLIYVALPALFYRILAKTPLEQIANVPFVLATTLATALAFAGAFAMAYAVRHDARVAAMAALAGAYGNIGYMGPGLALATLGAGAAVPVALIFCFDTIFLFSIIPALMAVTGSDRKGFAPTAIDVVKQIAFHPFIIATFFGALSAAVHFEAPLALDRLMEFLQNAAAPCALFALGVTVALRRLATLPREVPPLMAVKLVLHPILVLLLLSAFGHFPESWVYTAVLLAALPPALNVFMIARHYETWVEEASSAVLVGTVLSVVTLTSVMWLVKNRIVPVDLFP